MHTKHKLIALVAAILMLFQVVAPVMAAEIKVDSDKALKGYSPRLSEPTSSNLYYKHTSYGGYNECIWINSSTGSCMPNCVGYAWGRAYEILGSKPNLSKGNAVTFYTTNQSNGAYSYSSDPSKPQLGAIACWSGGSQGYGHVAVVEEINGSTITTSESAYGGTYWYTKTRYSTNSNLSAGSSYTFQGYIYVNGTGSTSTAPTITSPSDENGSSSAGTHFTANDDIRFSWTAVSGATKYWATATELTGTPGSSDYYAYVNEYTTELSDVLSSQYTKTGKWYDFCVAAVFSDGTQKWSPHIYVKVSDAVVGVTTPSISSPKNEYNTGSYGNVYEVGDMITFSWSNSSNATYYLYNVKRLDGQPNPGNDNETGTPYHSTSDWVSSLNANKTSSRSVTVPSSFINEKKWYKFAVGAYNSSSGSNWDYVYVYVNEQEIVYHTVTFKDGVTNGVITTAQVEHGKDVNFPEPPVHEGYIFKDWDKNGRNITADTIITALYEVNTVMHTVTFMDGLTNTVITIKEVEHGKDVIFPEPPVHDGYTFKDWDHSGRNITSDTTITALYEKINVPTPTPTATPTATPTPTQQPTPTPTAIPANAPQVVTDSKTTQAGQTVTVTVNLKNNPGFMYMRAVPVYDTSVMTLTAVTNGIYPSTTVNVQNTSYIWEADSNITGDGVLLTLTFTIKDGANVGDYTVGIEIKECYNYDEQDVTIYSANGTITITNILYGDCNGDGVIDGKDLVRLRKYLSQYNDATGTSPVEISAGADCNGDGKIDGKDLVRLRKYLSQYDDNTGTSPVHLGPEN